ncbi:hypothetical protein UA32_11755 [Photobacterium angustum]|uniref:Uncharacterized protein n=1 Tax=Photobacterium angustum TaxID=661 RepID=A0ABX5H1X8_PHOAN|nr:hypothetical protein [Photobacterium angustum]KJG37636.1 hypothetical protein UA32_11755 [Photobacterium angustum]PSX07092.1 hypothetical protein C0W27_16105 [Photobacterium angustum]
MNEQIVIKEILLTKYLYLCPNKLDPKHIKLRLPLRNGGTYDVGYLIKNYANLRTAYQAALIDRNNLGIQEWGSEWNRKKEL